MEKLFHCDKCGIVYKRKESLQVHMMKEHEKVKFTCPTCSKPFDTRYEVLKHERIAHSTDQKYECKYCGKRFGNGACLNKHLISHEDPKFPCRHYPKVLKKAKALEAHERYHTGEKPFKCSLCENSFVNKDRLSQHMRGAHKITGPSGGKAGWYRKEK